MNLYIVTYQFYDSDKQFKSYVNADSEYDAKNRIYHSFNTKPMINKVHQATEYYKGNYEISTTNGYQVFNS